MSKDEEEKKEYEELKRISDQVTEEKMKEMISKYSPLELYNKIHEEAWTEGFEIGMDVQLDELHEAAKNLSELHLHALHDMVEESENQLDLEPEEGN